MAAVTPRDVFDIFPKSLVTAVPPIVQNVRHSMHISSTYQMILEEGEIRMLRKLILRMGTQRLGPQAFGTIFDCGGALQDE